ncbi:MAG: transposase [Ramlibacter sp.]|nr:transposase [Ramlibacter sp.]
MSAAGIRHEFTQPGKPWQNGRIERFFLTLKQKLNAIVPEDRQALNGLLSEFAFWYNEVRPHQHLHGLTPAEAWRGIDPYRSAPKAVMQFEGWDGFLRGFYMRR